MSTPLEILYDDGPCLAILKPAGLATQAPAEFDSAEVRVKQFFREREGKTGSIYLGVPHRLDRPVSGVLLFARHVRAAQRLSQQFERRTVQKFYWACVEGTIEPASGTWRDHLKKIYGHPRAEIVDEGDPEGREAILHYRTIGRWRQGSWLEIRLETGRTHQIRVQAASRGFHIVGDRFYDATTDFGPPPVEERQRAIALHGRSLSFVHPMTRQPQTITAPPPPRWDVLERVAEG